MTLAADVIVVGAGPAGLAAVGRLLRAGQRVIWVDQGARPGGQVWRSAVPPRWAINAHRNLQQLAGHAVIATDGPARLLVQSLIVPASPALQVTAPKMLLALGARERFLPFPGWTLPGVHGAGGLQALVKNGWPVRGRRVLLAGSGPLLLAAADTMLAAGSRPAPDRRTGPRGNAGPLPGRPAAAETGPGRKPALAPARPALSRRNLGHPRPG